MQNIDFIDKNKLPALEEAAFNRLSQSAPQELIRWVENPPPLRLHVRTSAPKQERLLGILEKGRAALTGDLELRRWLAPLLDHTLLTPDADRDQIKKAAEIVKENGIGALCVQPAHVAFAKSQLEGTKAGVVTVAAFPHGTSHPQVTAAEVRQAIADGAAEVDMVQNVGLLRSGAYAELWEGIRTVTLAADPHPVKVILECAALDDEEILMAAWIARAAGAHYVKTATGFSPRGQSLPRHVALLRFAVGGAVGIKASGGIRTAQDAIHMILAGADRIGASSSVAILAGEGL